jgi:uncharacterized integral membrane protein
MKRFSWILTLPLSLIVIVFALSNRDSVAISLWPFELTQPVPLFLIMLGALFVGLLTGGSIAWLAQGRKRRDRRRAKREVKELSAEVARLRSQLESASRKDGGSGQGSAMVLHSGARG